jgi:protease YdgD
VPRPIRRSSYRQTGGLTSVVGLALALLCGATHAAEPRIVVDPDTPPWDAVAKVQSNTGVHCTGVLIAPATVLTAAHCLYNRRTRALLQAISLHVLFGYERDRYRVHSLVSQIVVGAGFNGAGPGPQLADWAKLRLTAPVQAEPLPLFAGRIDPGLPVALAGYNQDRAQLLLADVHCQVLRTIAGAGGGRFAIHDCAGTFGTSGGPLLTRTSAGWAVVGINVALGPRDNVAVVPPPER